MKKISLIVLVFSVFIVAYILADERKGKVRVEVKDENVYLVAPQTVYTMGVDIPPPPKGNPPDSRFDLTRPIWVNDYYGWPPYSNNVKGYHKDTRPRAGVGPAPGPRPSFTHSDVYYTRPTRPEALLPLEGTVTVGEVTPGDWTKQGNIV